MRPILRAAWVALVIAAPTASFAQSQPDPIQPNAGEPPPGQPLPSQPLPSQPVPGPPAAGQPGVGQPATGEPATPALQWLPRGVADLTVLDKIDAQASPLQIQVGQTVHYGSLTITVHGCYVRPPTMAPDATAWLDITDSRPGAPSFHGWMLHAEPALATFEHPVYDVRLAGCG
jgi:hypothetical protein